LIYKHYPNDYTHYLLVEHKIGFSAGQLFYFLQVSLNPIHFYVDLHLIGALMKHPLGKGKFMYD